MTSEIDIFDLIIIGGGLAGNSLALALEAHSLKIALIEAINPEQLAHSPAGDRALALSAGSIAILDTLGAWQAVKSNATAIKEIHVSDRGHFGKTRLSARKEGVDALGYVISARDIESQLARLVAGASIHRLCPARLAGLSFGQDHVNVKVNHNGESLLLKARLLAGADGGNSSVRTLLGIAQQTTEYNQTALVTTVKTALPHHNVAYERFTESGPLALLPAGKNLCSVVWTRTHEDAEALMQASEQGFLNSLQDCFGYRLGPLEITAPRRAFPLSLIRAEKMHSGRAVLIGNAVHQLHPVAGQGFNLGLRDVEQLAGMIIARHEPNQDIGHPDFISCYVSGRLRDHNQTITFTDSLINIFSNTLAPLVAARNISLTVLDHVPAAKHLLARHAMGLAQRAHL